MDVIVTTGDLRAPYKVIGPVFAHAHVILRSAYDDRRFAAAAQQAVDELCHKAHDMDADAVIGMRQTIASDLNHESPYRSDLIDTAEGTLKGSSLFRIHTYGTAVRFVGNENGIDGPTDDKARWLADHPYRVIVDASTATDIGTLAKAISSVRECTIEGAWDLLESNPVTIIENTTYEKARDVASLLEVIGAKPKILRTRT